MKHLKKALCLMVAVVMMMSIVAFPASASTTLDSRLLNDFPGFPVLRLNSSGGYVKLLQRFLYVCPATHEAIYNTSSTTHGIDGGFGTVTDGAVRTFQLSQFGVSGVDGAVGKDTWGAIYRWLNPDHSNCRYCWVQSVGYEVHKYWFVLQSIYIQLERRLFRGSLPQLLSLISKNSASGTGQETGQYFAICDGKQTH